jgi:hypothetical protein
MEQKKAYGPVQDGRIMHLAVTGVAAFNPAEEGCPTKPQIKACSRCKKFKFARGFYTADGSLSSRCRECISEVAKAKALKDPETARAISARSRERTKRNRFESHIMRRYGMGFEDWARLYEFQNGLCPGCGDRLVIETRRYGNSTHIDHDHADPKKVRGLLCQRCNIALGAARDNPATLLSLAVYLEANDNFDPGHLFYSDERVADDAFEAAMELELAGAA